MSSDDRYSQEDMRILRSMGVALDPSPALCCEHHLSHALLMERYAGLRQDLTAADRLVADREAEINCLAASAVRLRDFAMGVVAGFCAAAGFVVLALIVTGRLR